MLASPSEVLSQTMLTVYYSNFFVAKMRRTRQRSVMAQPSPEYSHVQELGNVTFPIVCLHPVKEVSVDFAYFKFLFVIRAPPVTHFNLCSTKLFVSFWQAAPISGISSGSIKFTLCRDLLLMANNLFMPQICGQRTSSQDSVTTTILHLVNTAALTVRYQCNQAAFTSRPHQRHYNNVQPLDYYL